RSRRKMPSRDIAILVGVGSFDDPSFKQLRFCKNDVDDLARALSNPEMAQFEIIKLHEPKRDEIVATLDKCASKLRPENKLLFYYAGHGKRSSGGKLYLIAKDSKLETLRATGVPIDQILDIMQESHSSQRVMILDCCHSGAVGGQFRGEIADNLQELARARGTCILAASTGIQLAEEREAMAENGKGNGIFTRYLVEGLDSGLAVVGGAEYVTVDSLYDYAFQRVVTTSTQTPMKWIIGGIGSIVLGRSTVGGWQKQREAIQKEFSNLHANQLISGAFLDRVQRVTNKEWMQLSPAERTFSDKLLLFSRRTITLIDLIPEQDGSKPAVEQNAASRDLPRSAENEPNDQSAKQSFFERNVVTFQGLAAFGRFIARTAIGPFLLLAIGTPLISSALDYRSERLPLLALISISALYIIFLMLLQINRARKSGGLSFGFFFNMIFLLALFVLCATIWTETYGRFARAP